MIKTAKNARTVPTRRQVMAHLAAGTMLGGVLAGAPLWAQDAAEDTPAADAAQPALPPAAETQPFSFDSLTIEMREAAKQPATAPQKVDGFLSKLDYDAYRMIRFNPEHARFADGDHPQFTLQAFHMGWLFREPVLIYEVKDGQAQAMSFSTDDFVYERKAREIVPEHAPLPGVAGFRLHHPLNRPDVLDELVAFQGASYFRALGRNSQYGLSARGLAVNTGLSVAEEFPRFRRFWVERPAENAKTVTVYAAMDSASLTGAYRFVITPGEATVMDVTARLFLRADVQQLGVAPLTSMFLYADRSRDRFDDFRPQVHDSDGLMIEKASGERVWRPLANPERLASSYFSESTPKSFGLYQRDREFEQYQDAWARYERRPSLKVEPTSDWGDGMVRLVEIPSEAEANDNIVAFWVPKDGAKAGQEREFSYRLSWGDLPLDPNEGIAHVKETFAGAGGVAGSNDKTRKFVVDFAGGRIANLPSDAVADLKVVNTISGGTITNQSFSKIPDHDIWRLVMDVDAEDGSTVELTAYLQGYGAKQSETWAYQWIKA
ncbi:glucan biosynthesis protein G [Thioclava sp. GXIMD4216]|uniref:Glucan biosynthesis protein G n=1 Tax=Thioclava litoralis TaxID=3076557 RepID=A0ABZ1E1J2_9RHOB|nr:glucan biosynthesis protein G [Thioclava sp. FTW29]